MVRLHRPTFHQMIPTRESAVLMTGFNNRAMTERDRITTRIEMRKCGCNVRYAPPGPAKQWGLFFSMATLTELIPRPKVGIKRGLEGGRPGRVDDKPTCSGSPAHISSRAGFFSCLPGRQEIPSSQAHYHEGNRQGPGDREGGRQAALSAFQNLEVQGRKSGLVRGGAFFFRRPALRKIMRNPLTNSARGVWPLRLLFILDRVT